MGEFVLAFSVLIPRILSDKTCPFRFPKQRRPNAQLEVSPSVYTIQQGGINQNPNFSISQSINALFPLLPTILTEKIIFDDFTTTCTIGGGFLEVFCYFVMWCHHVLGRHWSFPFSGFWKVGTLQMETLRFYTAGNQNILIRIRYNSLGCWACCMKLKKLTQESNAVFQKQGYYFSSKQLLWEGFIGLIT